MKSQKAIAILAATVVSIILGNAIVTLLFVTLGSTPESNTWNYLLILYALLAIAGVSGFLGISKLSTVFGVQKILLLVATGINSAIIGFYYGGDLSGKNTQIAIISAIATGLVSICLLLLLQRIFLLAVTVASLESAYSFALGMGVTSIHLIAVHNWIPALIYGGISLGYFLVAVRILLWVIPEALDKAGTKS